MALEFERKEDLSTIINGMLRLLVLGQWQQEQERARLCTLYCQKAIKY